MKNVCLNISYDGTNYCGWQSQKNALAIQDVVEESLSKLLGQEIKTYASGRTDAGVHALGQAINFLHSSSIPTDNLALALNNFLPKDIRAIFAFDVSNDFNARYSAKRKTYLYKIDTSSAQNAIDYRYSYHIPFNLNLDNMKKASQFLLGTHNFKAFAASACTVKNYDRTIYSSFFTQNKNILEYRVQANGFVYNMVRIIVGTLIDVGLGKQDIHCFIKAFDHQNRSLLGKTAPAKGLFLESVEY